MADKPGDSAVKANENVEKSDKNVENTVKVIENLEIHDIITESEEIKAHLSSINTVSDDVNISKGLKTTKLEDNEKNKNQLKEDSCSSNTDSIKVSKSEEDVEIMVEMDPKVKIIEETAKKQDEKLLLSSLKVLKTKESLEGTIKPMEIIDSEDSNPENVPQTKENIQKQDEKLLLPSLEVSKSKEDLETDTKLKNIKETDQKQDTTPSSSSLKNEESLRSPEKLIEIQDSEDSDSETQLCSPNLDPVKALYSPNVKLPKPNAPVFDNITVFAAKLKGKAAAPAKTIREKEEEMKKQAAKSSSKRFEAFGGYTIVPKKETIHKSLLDIMENIDGPLQLLTRCTKERLRIKVVTRNEKGIRGYCLGFLKAFDKQWNLAMTDVIEVWTRRRKKKIPAGIDKYTLSGQDIQFPIKVPVVKVRSIKKGVEECKRHISQFLMRGEHVVMVCVMS